MKRLLLIAALLPALAGCDQLKERMGLPDPARVEAEGKAVGGACRQAGRGIEDCYRLNAKADKAAIFAGWKEMNEYMLKNNMQAMPPEVPAAPPAGHKAAEHEGGAKDHAGEAKDAAAKEAEPKAEAKGHDKPAAASH